LGEFHGVTGEESLVAFSAIRMLLKPLCRNAVDRLAMRTDEVDKVTHEIRLQIINLLILGIKTIMPSPTDERFNLC
jgi:hypothetical protein